MPTPPASLCGDPSQCSTEHKEATSTRRPSFTRIGTLPPASTYARRSTLHGESPTFQTPLERKMHDDGQNCQGAKGDRIDGATTPETTGIRSWSVDSKGLRTKSSPLLSLRIGLTTHSRCCHFTRAAASCCQPVWRKAGTAVRTALHATESKRQRGHVPRASVARIWGMFSILDKHIYNALSWKSQMAIRPGCCVVKQEHVSHSHPAH